MRPSLSPPVQAEASVLPGIVAAQTSSTSARPGSDATALTSASGARGGVGIFFPVKAGGAADGEKTWRPAAFTLAGHCRSTGELGQVRDRDLAALATTRVARVVDLGTSLEEAWGCAPTAPGSQPVLLAAPPRLKVIAGSGRIRQVFRNIVANAAEHPPAKAIVTIRARRPAGRAPMAAPFIAARCDQEPPEAGAHMSGPGLGRYLSKRVVEANGGRLGAGAAFAVSIRVAA